MAEDPKPGQQAAAQSAPNPDEQAVPEDALSRSNSDLRASGVDTGGFGEHGSSLADRPEEGQEGAPKPNKDPEPPKKAHTIKRLIKRFNIYLLLFVLFAVVAAAIAIVTYLNSREEVIVPPLGNQTLDEETLKQLANSDATVGGSGQTLTIQGNAIIEGEELVRGNLNVAGDIALGGDFSMPRIIVSDSANINDGQINTLKVAGETILQGELTMQSNLTVAGQTALNGPVAIGELTVTKLIMGGNGQLEVPNHLNFTGPTPNRIMNAGILGAGGSASVSGSDSTGTININTGIGASSGCFIRIIFNIPYTNTPHVLVTPINSEAGRIRYYVTRSNTEFSVCAHDSPQASQNFGFDYFVTGI